MCASFCFLYSLTMKASLLSPDPEQMAHVHASHCLPVVAPCLRCTEPGCETNQAQHETSTELQKVVRSLDYTAVESKEGRAAEQFRVASQRFVWVTRMKHGHKPPPKSRGRGISTGTTAANKWMGKCRLSGRLVCALLDWTLSVPTMSALGPPAVRVAVAAAVVVMGRAAPGRRSACSKPASCAALWL